MKPTYWQQQTPRKPLFPGLLWSRPENRQHAGKLLIIGGSAHGFAAPAEAYTQAGKAGAGATRVILPSALAKTIGKVFEAGEYAPSTPSGSFAQRALSDCLSLSLWADAVLLAGDFGRNSETAILLEKFVEKQHGALALTGDAVDYFLANPNTLLAKEHVLITLTFQQLQKLAIGAHTTHPFTSQQDLVHFVTTLHAFSKQHAQTYFLIEHLDMIFIAVDGVISSTSVPDRRKQQKHSLLHAAAYATVWLMQNPGQAFEALTTSLAE
jgi:hypothetical protein